MAGCWRRRRGCCGCWRLLQVRRDWGGAELAERLGVSTRTLRTDVERLRSLGYPVEARPGVAGGYRLGAGGVLPPLLLDDEEAVAVAVGLRTAAAGGVAGIEETSVRALVKLEQVLPGRLRGRVRAVAAATVAVGGAGPRVDAEVLTGIAGAIRDRERLRFDYAGGSGGVWGEEPRGDEGDAQDITNAAALQRRTRWRRAAATDGGAASVGGLGAAVVFGCLGQRSRGLADVSGGSDESQDA